MKVFNEKETAAILKTAAEQSHKGLSNEDPGLTINELEVIAKEAGIDPSEISKAVEALENKSQPIDHDFWGGPFSFSEHVQIDHEITSVEWENMLVSIRAFFQSPGEVHTRDIVHEWRSPRGTSNSAHITAVKEHSKTNVSVNWSGPLTALPFYLPIPLVGIASLVFASEFLGLGAVSGWSFVALAIGLTFVTGRAALRRHMNKGFTKLKTLSAKLQATGHTEKRERDESNVQQDAQRLETEVTATKPLLDLELDDPVVSGTTPEKALRSKE